MKRILIAAVCLVAACLSPIRGAVVARDYMVDFVSENYREKSADDGSRRQVFHSIQVNTDLGSRLLILNGDDFQYRNWLRSYLSHTDRLIIRVPDADDAAFRKSRVYDIDVTRIYPIDGNQWQAPGIGVDSGPAFTGKRHVLIVDANEKRRGLIDLIVKDLGYPVTLSVNGSDALLMFRRQPDKFCMVIADATLPGISGTELVKDLIHMEPRLPVILGTTYGDKTMEANAAASFSGSDSVAIKPVVLQELPKTILALLKEQV